MSLHNDFMHFVDSGSKVPYFVDGVNYYRKPIVYSELIEYDFKQFYKCFNGCFVGIGCSSFVRKISVSEFEMIKELYEAKEKSLKEIKERVQLTFF